MTTQTPKPDQQNRGLKLNYSGRVIDHLGIQMYQNRVAAIAELVANAWDADASRVSIELPQTITPASEIVISDDGIGMTFQECQDKFLNVGFSRRGNARTERSKSKNRRILGRKGIGKFAGFGIAEVIRVETISQETGEKTIFEMDINKIRSDTYVNFNGSDIAVVAYEAPHDTRRTQHGTKVILKHLIIQRAHNPADFARSMAKRFVLRQSTTDFQILINGTPMTEGDDNFPIQFSFPRDYRKNERPDGLAIKGEWGTEIVGNDEIEWRVRFYKSPIGDEELRGISVFAGVKMVQAPFFFNLSGSLPGQHGQQYISGQIKADFLDEQNEDLTAPERQRVNWDHPNTVDLREWGRVRLRQLLGIWRDRRGQERQQQLENRLAGFSNRLGKLPKHEQNTVSQAIRRIAQIETLEEPQFEELGSAMVTAWEQGRLKDLIHSIASADDLTADQLIDILAEAEVLTALNVAEAVQTKLQAVNGLKQRINNHELENAVRDYISNHPWLVSPEWETFAVERGVQNIVTPAATEAQMTAEDDFRGRIDLAMSSGKHLLVLEFMRPGITMNWDHVNRFERYVRIIKAQVAVNTAGRFNQVTGYIIADKLHTSTGLPERIQALVRDDMFALDWHTLLSKAEAQWQDFLEILAVRDPQDERLKALLANSK